MADSPISRLSDKPEVLRKIFLLLFPDLRTIWRCLSVCRLWNSQISSAAFHTALVKPYAHLVPTKGNPDQGLGFVFPWSITPFNEERLQALIPKVEPATNICALDVSYDLVLLGIGQQNGDVVHPDKELRSTLFICNAFTMEWLALPLAPERETRLVSHLVCFGRWIELKSKRFLYISKFSVVRMAEDPAADRQIDYFNSSDGVWKTKTINQRRSTEFPNVVSASKAVFWLSGGGVILSWSPFEDSADVKLVGDTPSSGSLWYSANKFRTLDLESSRAWVKEEEEETWYPYRMYLPDANDLYFLLPKSVKVLKVEGAGINRKNMAQIYVQAELDGGQDRYAIFIVHVIRETKKVKLLGYRNSSSVGRCGLSFTFLPLPTSIARSLPPALIAQDGALYNGSYDSWRRMLR